MDAMPPDVMSLSRCSNDISCSAPRLGTRLCWSNARGARMAPAITVLMLVAEYAGSTTVARIGVMRLSTTTAGMPRSVQEKNKIYRIIK